MTHALPPKLLPVCRRITGILQQSLDHAFNGAIRPIVLTCFNAFCRQLPEDFQETLPQPCTRRLLSSGIVILTRSDHRHKILKIIIQHGLGDCQPSPSAAIPPAEHHLPCSSVPFVFLEHLLEYFHLGHQ